MVLDVEVSGVRSHQPAGTRLKKEIGNVKRAAAHNPFRTWHTRQIQSWCCPVLPLTTAALGGRSVTLRRAKPSARSVPPPRGASLPKHDLQPYRVVRTARRP